MTRKLIAVLLAACAVLGARGNEWTDPETGYTWTYTISGKAAEICGVSPSSTGTLMIPSKLGGKTVTRIGDNVFYYCTWLTSVKIPDCVTSIGVSTFEGCSGITNVTIPDSVTKIEEYAFASSGLTTISIPGSVMSIGGGRLSRAMALRA